MPQCLTSISGQWTMPGEVCSPLARVLHFVKFPLYQFLLKVLIQYNRIFGNWSHGNLGLCILGLHVIFLYLHWVRYIHCTELSPINLMAGLWGKKCAHLPRHTSYRYYTASLNAKLLATQVHTLEWEDQFHFVHMLIFWWKIANK